MKLITVLRTSFYFRKQPEKKFVQTVGETWTAMIMGRFRFSKILQIVPEASVRDGISKKNIKHRKIANPAVVA